MIGKTNSQTSAGDIIVDENFVVNQVDAVKPCIEVMDYATVNNWRIGAPWELRVSPLTADGWDVSGAKATLVDFPLGMLHTKFDPDTGTREGAMSALKKVHIPRGDDGPRHIIRFPPYVFSGLPITDFDLELSIENGDYVHSVGDYAFYGTGNLTSSLDLSKVTNIGKYAFAHSNMLITAISPTVPVGDYAFANSNLQAARVPRPGKYSFAGCVNLPADLVSYDCRAEGAFKDCTQLKRVLISQRYCDVLKLPQYIFDNTPIGRKEEGTGLYIWHGGKYYPTIYSDTVAYNAGKINIYGWLDFDGNHTIPADDYTLAWYEDMDFLVEIPESERISPVLGKRYYCKKK